MCFHRRTGLSPHQLDVLTSRVRRKMPDWDQPTRFPETLESITQLELLQILDSPLDDNLAALTCGDGKFRPSTA
jgi:hypothetical protein